MISLARVTGEALHTDVIELHRDLPVWGTLPGRNNLLLQRQADLLGVPCVRPTVLETTGLGSGLLAGLACGVWSSQDEIRAVWKEERRFLPQGDPNELKTARAQWKQAVERA